MKLLERMVELAYRWGPGVDYEARPGAIRVWSESLGTEDALALVEWAEASVNNTATFAVPDMWKYEFQNSACSFAGEVEKRLQSGVVRERLEQLLDNEKTRYCGLIGLEQIASTASLPALGRHIADDSFAVVDQLARAFTEIGSPIAVAQLQEMLKIHERDPKKLSSIRCLLREVESREPR